MRAYFTRRRPSTITLRTTRWRSTAVHPTTRSTRRRSRGRARFISGRRACSRARWRGITGRRSGRFGLSDGTRSHGDCVSTAGDIQRRCGICDDVTCWLSSGGCNGVSCRGHPRSRANYVGHEPTGLFGFAGPRHWLTAGSSRSILFKLLFVHAIVSVFTELLEHLLKHRPNGRWDFVGGDQPVAVAIEAIEHCTGTATWSAWPAWSRPTRLATRCVAGRSVLGWPVHPFGRILITRFGGLAAGSFATWFFAATRSTHHLPHAFNGLDKLLLADLVGLEAVKESLEPLTSLLR